MKRVSLSSVFRGLIFFLAISPVASGVSANGAKTSVCDMALRDLGTVQNIMEVAYAPREWKEKHFGWDMDKEIAEARAQVQANPNLGVRGYQEIFRRFFTSTRDYHVSVSFVSTEHAQLPITVKSSKGRYFIANVDREALPLEKFPFQEGDEIVEFNGAPVQKEIDAIKAEMLVDNESKLDLNNEQTDQALAALFFNSRKREHGHVPSGVAHLKIQPKNGSAVQAVELDWAYQQELIRETDDLPAPPSAPRFIDSANTAEILPSKDRLPILNRQMVVPFSDLNRHRAKGKPGGKPVEENPHGLGSRKSFVPDLDGKKIWQTEEENPFYAYIVQTEDGQHIGFLRLANYVPEDADKAVKAFEEIIQEFESKADAVVVDQINNPGGSILYLYALASMLSDKPLQTPTHRMAITEKEVQSAVAMSRILSVPKLAKIVLGKSLQGYPVNNETIAALKEYFDFVAAQWNQQKYLTDPHYMYGIKTITPSANVRLTKPILFLTNELDFSGGDFMPAILQDNQRVTTLGTKTAGAGGYVIEQTYTNRLGIAGFRTTGSIAERVKVEQRATSTPTSRDPIENLGVQPDVEYQITPHDIQNGYPGYKAAIQQALQRIMHR